MEDLGHHHHHHHQGHDVQDLCHLISASRTSPAPACLFPPPSSTPDPHRDPFRSPPPGYLDHHLLSSIQGLVPGPDHVRTTWVIGGGGAVPESPLVVTPSTDSPWTGDGDGDVGRGGGSGRTSRGDIKLEREHGGDGGGGGGGGRRWPRQETLMLLEVRSRLDPRFKQANHKGPLWDEVSRILLEEHGYQRSGKKCREKFENLYKYYKKTKESKAGRQDGKHYRFFRQLEALYGESAATADQIESSGLVVGDSTQAPLLFRRPDMANPRKNDAVGPSNSTTGGPCEEACRSLLISTDDTDALLECYNEDEDKKAGNKGKGKRSWKEKIRVFVDSRVRKLVEKQEEWLRRMTRALEEKEKERVVREEEWRRREAERFEREQEFWLKERAWIEARDAAFMDTVRSFPTGDREIEKWQADCLGGKEALGKKKRKELESRYSFCYGDEAVPERREEIERTLTARVPATMTWNMPNMHGIITNNGSSSSPCDSHNDNDGDNSSTGVHHQDLNCLRYLIGDPGVGENLWDNFELKRNK
ncbi:hypothetical protein MLD38_032509 [Melastoma candidum]|uniref:Uncharacterized protein n=1 Tax=Melastoma candidum TaxID=119954 RepID=A0ACB9M6A2_9MYRT|nr:hypothetical protein MLD38_032509 [Melastoma candidum]